LPGCCGLSCQKGCNALTQYSNDLVQCQGAAVKVHVELRRPIHLLCHAPSAVVLQMFLSLSLNTQLSALIRHALGCRKNKISSQDIQGIPRDWTREREIIAFLGSADWSGRQSPVWENGVLRTGTIYCISIPTHHAITSPYPRYRDP
jgi:hypothetical protein